MKLKKYIFLFLFLSLFETLFAASFRSSVSYFESCLTKQEFCEMESKRDNLEVISYFESFDKNDLFELKLKLNDAVVEFVDLLYASKCSLTNIFSNYVATLVKNALYLSKQKDSYKESLKTILLALDKISKEVDCLDYSLLEDQSLKDFCFKFENLKVLMELLIYSKPSESKRIKSQFLFRKTADQENFDDSLLSKVSVDSIILWEIGKRILEDKGFLVLSTKSEIFEEEYKDIPSLEVEWQKELSGVKKTEF